MGKIYKKFRETALENKKRKAVHWRRKGHWTSYRYGELLGMIDNLASGLEELGISSGDRVAIFSENRWEWAAADLAINKLGAISVPIHFTSNNDTIEYILNDSGSEYLFLSKKQYKKHKDFFDNLGELEEMILFSREEARFDYFTLFEDLINSKTKKETENITNEKNIASIIYTSGTTGDPKGVMLSEDNFLLNVAAVLKKLELYKTDVFLSFLPMSHVLERTAGHYIPILNGASVAYVGDIKKLSDYFFEVRPTLMIGVPKIFEKSYEKIFETVKAKGRIMKKIFFWSLKFEHSSLGWRVVHFLLFKRIRRQVYGGRLRFAVCGGANIDKSILKFFKKLGVNIIQGYGLTETSPIVSGNSLEKNRLGTVGQALDGVEIKIAEDKEIKVRGHNVMLGYWRNKEKSREKIDDQGWFSTGDLGYLDEKDFLTIIGRKKDIIVTSNGKNVSPEKIESLLNLNIFISQSLVVGHRQRFLAVLIVPDKKEIEKKYGARDEDFVFELINKEIEKINSSLESHEKIEKIKIIDEEFTIEKGELTPTLKIRRKIIESKYKKTIDYLYK